MTIDWTAPASLLALKAAGCDCREKGYQHLHRYCEEDAAQLVRHFVPLVDALKPIAAAYSDDPGTSDLDNEQPVTITLGDVRRVWRALAGVTERPKFGKPDPFNTPAVDAEGNEEAL